MERPFSKRHAEQPNPQTILKVEGKEDSTFEAPEASKKEKTEVVKKTPEEVAEAIKKVDALLQRYQNFLTTFAKDNSLRFKAGNAFQINPEDGVITNDVRWFMDKGFTETQILWAHLHEISHFRDLAEDKKGMEERVEYEVKRARATGRVMMQKWIETAGEDHPIIERLERTQPLSKKNKSQLNQVELAGFKIHHTFYNILDDIWVNSSVARRAPRYSQGTSAGDEIESLYKDKLFAPTDYKDLPRHMQFLYVLLREHMVPGEKVGITEEVQDVLNRPIIYKGKTYTARDIVQSFIKPQYRLNTTVSRRNKVIQECLEPLFDELLSKDLVDWKPKLPPEQNPDRENKSSKEDQGSPEDAQHGESEESESWGDSDPSDSQSEEGSEDSPQPGSSKDSSSQEVPANPFESAYKEFDENSPDQLDEDEVQSWIDREPPVPQNDTRSESRKARDPDDIQRALDKKWLEKNDIDRATWSDYRQHEQEVEPYLEDLSRVWRRVVYGSSTSVRQRMQGHFNTGTELDVQRAVDEFPRIQQGEMFKTRVMKRMLSEKVDIPQPELIRVRLLGDVSGSMFQEGRIEALKKCFVLLLSSLNEFNTYLDLTRSVTKSKLRVDTEAWSFGEYPRLIKPFDSAVANPDKKALLVSSFEDLRNARGEGYTDDGSALEEVLRSLNPEDRQKIVDKKIMELVFEITDGGSSDPYTARDAVDELIKAGVIVKSFQIGNPDSGDRRTFQDVWNRGRSEPAGEAIGNDLGNLVPALSELLKKHLGNVQV
jgi:hypothetical protein